jgi:molybdenum cofactor synthesis domain-containing protein
MKKKFKKVNAAILIIGNEILSGRTQDLNVSFISNWLNDSCGIKVEEVRIVSDNEKIIIKTVNELRKKFNYVFTTGGIGPTHDDITAESISKAFKVKYEYHKEAFTILEKYYGKIKFNDGRKKMSKMPRGSRLIYNPSSAAPGFKIDNVFCLPGVPLILRSMIHNCLKYLKRGSKLYSTSINLITVESNIAKGLAKIQKKYKKEIDIGSYPFFRLGRIGVSIVLRSQNKHKINLCKKEILKDIVQKKKIKKV